MADGLIILVYLQYECKETDKNKPIAPNGSIGRCIYLVLDDP